MTLDPSFFNPLFLLIVGVTIFLAARAGNAAARAFVLTLGLLILGWQALNSGNLAYMAAVAVLVWLAWSWQHSCIPWRHIIFFGVTVVLLWFFWPYIQSQLGGLLTRIQNMRGGITTTLPSRRVGDLIPGLEREAEAHEFRRFHFRVRVSGTQNYVRNATIIVEGGPIGNDKELGSATKWVRRFVFKTDENHGEKFVPVLILPGRDYRVRAEFQARNAAGALQWYESGEQPFVYKNTFPTDPWNPNYETIPVVLGNGGP